MSPGSTGTTAFRVAEGRTAARAALLAPPMWAFQRTTVGSGAAMVRDTMHWRGPI